MKDLKQTAEEYGKEGNYPFHMPGHKRRDLVFPGTEIWDFTEITGFDDLHHPEGILLEAEQRAAELYGAEHTAFLVNGSSAGILSAVMCATSPGDRILCPRNVHRSVLNAIRLNALKVVWLDTGWLFPGVYDKVTVSAVEKACREHPGIRAVLITSPGYEGVLSEVEEIAGFCRKKGIPFLVDEAHGAHFLPFAKGFPKSAVTLGADFVIQSLHKTLPALTQTGLIHVRKEEDFQRLSACLDIFQTSSPSYLLMGSIDRCLGFLSKNGEALFADYRKRLDRFRQSLGDLKQLILADEEGRDPGKLLIRIPENTGLTGRELLKRLREEYRLELEMAGADYVLAMTSIMDTEEGFERLSKALLEIDRGLSSFSRIPTEGAVFLTSLPEKRMELSDAMRAESEEAELSDAKGRILSGSVLLYPPGTPLAAAGEVVSEELIRQIRYFSEHGYSLYGLSPSGRVSVVKL